MWQGNGSGPQGPAVNMSAAAICVSQGLLLVEPLSARCPSQGLFLSIRTLLKLKPVTHLLEFNFAKEDWEAVLETQDHLSTQRFYPEKSTYTFKKQFAPKLTRTPNTFCLGQSILFKNVCIVFTNVELI